MNPLQRFFTNDLYMRAFIFLTLLTLSFSACKKDKFAKAEHNGIYIGTVQQFDLSDSSFTVLSDSFPLELRKKSAFKYEIISPDENILPSLVFKSRGAAREGVVFAENPDDESWYMFIDYLQPNTGLAVGKTEELDGTVYPSILFEGWRY